MLELREWVDTTHRNKEIELPELRPSYTGAEGFWTDRTFDWLVYASHESSVTIAGKRLLPALVHPGLPGRSTVTNPRGRSERGWRWGEARIQPERLSGLDKHLRVTQTIGRRIGKFGDQISRGRLVGNLAVPTFEACGPLRKRPGWASGLLYAKRLSLLVLVVGADQLERHRLGREGCLSFFPGGHPLSGAASGRVVQLREAPFHLLDCLVLAARRRGHG